MKFPGLIIKIHVTRSYRYISTSKSVQKIVSSSGKSSSSNAWLTRQLNDQYTKKSRYENYRCRSAYKLLEIHERFKILQPGLSVVDCGAAPGSWSQVVSRRLLLDKKELLEGLKSKGCLISVDIQHLDPIVGATILKETDFTKPETQEHIKSLLPDGTADLVLSDMAPNATGIKDIDSANINRLVYSALKFCMSVLKKDGSFLCKTWDSEEVSKLVHTLSFMFGTVKRIKPKASYADSSELFLLARGFKYIGRHIKDKLKPQDNV